MIHLKMVKGSEMAEGVQTEQRLPEPLARYTIGRDPANHWPIPDRTLAISARHCEVAATPAGVVLRDLSTNGTFVNGAVARLSGEHLLQDGDRIELGPYTIVVQSGLPRAAAVPVRPVEAPPPAPLRSPSVEATAPLRGGDPAAMLASVAPARAGLTEILRAAPPAEDSSLEVTKIRLAPKGAGAPAARPAGTTPMPVVGAAPGPAAATTPAAQPAVTPPAAQAAAYAPLLAPASSRSPSLPPALSPALPPASSPARSPALAPVPAPASRPVPPSASDTDALLAHLAGGLGLPADALAGRDPAQTAAQVGALARAAVTVLRQLLEQQAQDRRQIGSRAPALQAVRDVNPLRLAATPDAALRALLAPGADAEGPLKRAAAELAAHQDRLLAAFRGAATRLGQEIAPPALEAALAGSAPPAAAAERQAQLWLLYTQVWQGIGLAPGQPWSQGFLEAALLHLATAYDEHGKA